MGVGEAEINSGIGVHMLVDMYDAPPDVLSDADALCCAMVSAACVAGMTPLSQPVVHTFPPRHPDEIARGRGGVTVFLPLAESHIAVHTYPGVGYLALDIFTCGNESDGDAPDRAVQVLTDAVRPARFVVRRCARGDGLETR